MSQANDIERINAYFKVKRYDEKAQNPLSQGLVAQWNNWYGKLGFFAKTLSADAFHTALRLQNTFAYSMGEEYNSYGAGMVSGFGADQLQYSLTTTGMTRNYNNTTILGRGSTGPYVKSWQAIIGAKQDGDFGPATESATKKWQSAHGLTADGVVGPETWAMASNVTPAPVLAKIQEEEHAATGVPQDFSGATGITPSGSIDLGDVDRVGFVNPALVVAPQPVQEAGLLGTLEALPTWAKVGLGVAAVGSTVYYAPKKYGGLGK